VWTECIWFVIVPVVGTCKHGNETSDAIKSGESSD
jgi:hypothetical protein